MPTTGTVRYDRGTTGKIIEQHSHECDTVSVVQLVWFLLAVRVPQIAICNIDEVEDYLSCRGFDGPDLLGMPVHIISMRMISY